MRWLSNHSKNSKVKAKASSSERWVLDAIKDWKQFHFVIATADSTICGRLWQKLPLDTYVPSNASILHQRSEGLEYGRLSAADSNIVDQLNLITKS
jgi:hypothetical protein